MSLLAQYNLTVYKRFGFWTLLYISACTVSMGHLVEVLSADVTQGINSLSMTYKTIFFFKVPWISTMQNDQCLGYTVTNTSVHTDLLQEW